MIIKLNEKWHTIDAWGSNRLWFSDSAIKFKNFMQNLHSSGLKGVRLCIAKDFYLVADAQDYSHDHMIELAEEELYLEVPSRVEGFTCGIPKCTDFELGNYELADLKQYAIDYPDDADFIKYLDYDADKDYQGRLIADYGTFELSLYAFNSKAYPDYIVRTKDFPYFEDSETYRVLKPLLKKIYIYGK